MNQPFIQGYDLTTKEGIMAYVESELIPVIRSGFERQGSLVPFGVAFVTSRDGAHLPQPLPINVGKFGQTPRDVKSSLRKVATNGAAIGAVFVSQSFYPIAGSTTGGKSEAIVIQLEHKFGDMCWCAPIVGKQLTAFSMATEIDQMVITVKTPRVLSARHLN